MRLSGIVVVKSIKTSKIILLSFSELVKKIDIYVCTLSAEKKAEGD